MIIGKIIFVDDRNFLFEEFDGKLENLKNTIKKALEKNPIDINLSDAVELKMFYQKRENNEWTPYKENEQIDWVTIFSYFTTELESEENILVFCDYSMEHIDTKFHEKIYETVKTNTKVVFVCYSSIDPENAQKWLDKITNEPHDCKLIDTVLPISYEYNELLASLKEAIIDEWKE